MQTHLSQRFMLVQHWLDLLKIVSIFECRQSSYICGRIDTKVDSAERLFGKDIVGVLSL